MDIGFIGLGNMGRPMARQLIEAGHSLVVYDTRNDATAPLLALGAQLAASPQDVADRVETVMASLPEPHVVTKVATGAGGVIDGKRVKRFIDLSTTGSRVAIEIAAALAKQNIVQIDAPVSGGVAGAEKGTLAVMVSGPAAEVASVKDALAVFGKVFVIGEKPGMGQTMKLANNVLSACNMAASCEAVVLAAKSGIDPKVAVDVMNAGSGRNSATSDKWPREMLTRTFNWGFATALMTKDVRLALAEMKDLDVPHDIMDAVGRAWETCIAEIGPDQDFTTIIQPVEQRGGIIVKGGAT